MHRWESLCVVRGIPTRPPQDVQAVNSSNAADNSFILFLFIVIPGDVGAESRSIAGGAVPRPCQDGSFNGVAKT